MSTNRTKSIKNIIFSLLGQVVTISIGLLLPRLYVVTFGSEVNGLLNSVNQYIIYLGLFEAGVGAVTLQALYKPISNNDNESVNGILSATHKYYKKTGFWYLITLIAFSFAYPLLFVSELNYYFIVGVVFLSGISNVVLYYFQGKYKILLQAEGKNYIITNLSTVTHVLVGLLKIVLIYFGLGIVEVLVASFILNALQSVYICLYIKKNYKWINVKATPDYKSISQKNSMLVHQVSGLIFQNTDVIFLTMVCGLKVVSVYSMYKLIITHIESLLSIIMNSVSFAFGQIYQKDKEKYVRIIDAFESFYSAICFAFFAVTLHLITPFMKLYTSGVSDINYVDEVLAFLFVAIALLTVMRTPMLNTINYAGHFKSTLAQTIIETAINLVVSIVLVFQIGIYGVLIGTVVALLYRTNDIIIYANTKLLDRKPIKTYMIYLTNFITLVLLLFAFDWIFGMPIKNYMDFIAIGAISSIISLIVFVSAQILIFPKHFKTVLNTLKSR